MSKHAVVIVRKKKGGHGGGHHGGSWKVALADFAIAMMALFLLLWILSSTDEDQKAAIASYFDDPGAFRHPHSMNPIDFGGQDGVVQTPQSGPAMKGRKGPELIGNGNAQNQNRFSEFKQLTDELQRLIGGEKLAGRYEDYIYLEQLPEGLRVVIMDNENTTMFEKGSDQLKPFFQDLLVNLAPILNDQNSRLMISGHTDSSGYQRADYSNWELSSARAQAARRTLIYGGLSDQKILIVQGMADRVLRDPETPESSVNRRIEVMVLAKDMEKRIESIFAPVVDETRETEGKATKSEASEQYLLQDERIKEAFEQARANQKDG